jgi:anti-sigma factor ChrR (cupin superfamily)
MSSPTHEHDPDHSQLAYLYALQALPAGEMAAAQAHIAECAECRSELAALRPVVDSLVAWPTEGVHPPSSLWRRLAGRIGEETNLEALPSAAPAWDEPEWKEVAPGISCKMLATDAATEQVSMLVRLAPSVDYPPHAHAGIEELHLLDGELWIDGRKLFPGDYNRAEAGTSDQRVWSETGCTCLLITSARDVLR